MSLLKKLSRSLHGPRCHLEPEEKAWVERRLLWLKQQFGSEPIRRPPLDLTSPLLPKSWNPSYEASNDLFDRLCGFMRVERSRVEVNYFSEAEPIGPFAAYGEREHSGPAGLYIDPENQDRLIIALDQRGLNQPASLGATICHELAHVHLLAGKRIAHDAEDMEPVTDLLTVYFGAGILTANTSFQFNQWQEGNWGGWSTSRQGYMKEAQYGFALACYAWFRGERQPTWAKFLRENIAFYFDDSMHFLSTTNDTTIPFDGA